MEKIYKTKYIYWIICILLIILIFYLLYLLYKKYTSQIYKNKVIQKLIYGKNIESFISSQYYQINNQEVTNNQNQKENNVDYELYESNKLDSYNFLVRDLLVHNKDINHFFKSSFDHVYEHMENEKMDELFPDMNKTAFRLNENQNPSDLLEKKTVEIIQPKLSDALLNMDTRPPEQKELDNLLNDLNIFMYLLKQRIIDLLSRNKEIIEDQKISLYYSLFEDTKDSTKNAFNIYNENKLTPNYTIDESLDKRANKFLDKDDGIVRKFIVAYKTFQKSEDSEQLFDDIESISIPVPKEIGNEDEDEPQDSFLILREFADNVKNFYESLNIIIAPYFNYILDLGLVPYPRDNDSQDPDSPDNKAAAALMASYGTEILTLASTYNDIMINYILNEDIYSLLEENNDDDNKNNEDKNKAKSLLQKLQNIGITKMKEQQMENRDLKKNLLSLPNISNENLITIKSLLKNNVITVEQISGFDKTVRLITYIYDYFKSINDILLESDDPEKIDIISIENIIKGITVKSRNISNDDDTSPLNNDRIKLIKKYDPLPDDDVYTFALDNLTQNNQYIFKSLVDGFTTDKGIPSGPTKESVKKSKLKQINQAFTKFGNDIVDFGKDAGKELTKVGNKIAEGTVDVAKDVAKGTTEVANKVAEGTTEVANKVAEGTTEVANKVAEGTVDVAKDVAKGTTEVANKVAEGTTEVAKDIAKGTTEIVNDVGKELKDFGKQADQGLKDFGKKADEGLKDFGKDADKGLKKAGKSINKFFK